MCFDLCMEANNSSKYKLSFLGESDSDDAYVIVKKAYDPFVRSRMGITGIEKSELVSQDMPEGSPFYVG